MSERGSFNPEDMMKTDGARLAEAKAKMQELFASPDYQAELAQSARVAESEHAREVEGKKLAEEIMEGVGEVVSDANRSDLKKAA